MRTQFESEPLGPEQYVFSLLACINCKPMAFLMYLSNTPLFVFSRRKLRIHIPRRQPHSADIPHYRQKIIQKTLEKKVGTKGFNWGRGRK